jgi:hypothetical protein
MKDMKKHKQELKKELVEDEKLYIEKTEVLGKDHRKKEQYMGEENDGHLT